MNRLLAAVVLAMLSVSVNAQMPALTAAEQAAGWRLIFDGQSLAGWRGYRSQTPPSGWRVVNGELVRQGPGGDLMTVEQYADFEMRFEWKVTEKANSGVIYRIAEMYEFAWQTGPEYQVLHNQGHADGKDPTTSAGSLYALYAPVKDVTRPVGQWNEGRVIARGNHVEHWTNGVKVLQYEIGSPDWNARITASKFAIIPAFGRIKAGHIALQDHGDVVSYRALKIKTL